MAPASDALATLAGFALLIGAGALLAWILRLARAPGGAVAAGLKGGALAGLLLGATALGKVAPDVHAHFYLGAGAERRELIEVERRHEIEAAALLHTGVSEAALDELRARQSAERDAAVDALAAAESARRGDFDGVALALFGLLLFTGGCGIAGRRSAPDDTPAHNAFGAGLFVVLLGAIPGALLARWTLHLDPGAAAAFGATLGIGGAFPDVRARRVGAPGRSRAVDLAALGAFVFGAAAVAGLGARSPGLLGALVAAPAGLALRALATPPRAARRALGAVAVGGLVPALAGCAAIGLDALGLADSSQFWIGAVIALIFATDGRWLGGWLGWRLLGSARARDEAWRRSGAVLNACTGPTQVGCAIGLASLGLIAPPTMGAILVGAIALELSAGLRARFARRLDTGP